MSRVARAQKTPVRRLGHRASLDGVRAVAIIGVMGLHTVPRLFPGGFYGVDVFFVLSAFLITSLVIEEHDEHGRFDFRSFYWRRAFRLGPALMLWLVLIAPATAIALHQSANIPFATAASLFYFSDFALAEGAKLSTAYKHVWSLSVEEQFYLVWPYILVAFVLAKSAVAQRRALLIGVELSIVALVLTDDAFGAGNYFLPTGHIVALAAGCLAATLFMRGGGARLERALSARPVGPVCLALLAIAIAAYPSSLGNEEGAPLLIAIAAITAALLLHLCLRPAGAAHALLSTRPALWLGRRSYGLYLYNLTFTILIPALLPGSSRGYTLPLAVAIGFAVAELSYRCIERPVNRAGRAWLGNKRARVAPARSPLPAPSPQAVLPR
jgi:peptidoglycan/LPS O-acetylase OafA/YrhL